VVRGLDVLDRWYRWYSDVSLFYNLIYSSKSFQSTCSTCTACTT
jgi:hypothetical protein